MKIAYFKHVHTHLANTEKDCIDLQYSRESDILSCLDKSIPINLHCTDCVEDKNMGLIISGFTNIDSKKPKCWGNVKRTIICVTMHLK